MPLKIHPTYTAQWNASFQRQITANWLASASYMGNKTTHIWVGEDINPAVFGPGATTGNTNQRRLLYRQNPVAGAAYASITESDQGGNGHYHGLLLSIQHRFAHNFTLLTNYTWSHCISEVDFTGELAASQYQNPFDRHANLASCNFDVRHNFNTSLVASTPAMGGRVMSAIVKDWQIAPILSARSGIAINVTTGTDASLTGVNQDRPDLILPSPYPDQQTTGAFLNRAAFRANAAGTYGNLGRDAVNGPRQVNFDVALSRTFRFTERWRLEARGEAFNIINRANYSNPTTALNSSNFGRILAAGDPRIMQVGMKLKF